MDQFIEQIACEMYRQVLHLTVEANEDDNPFEPPDWNALSESSRADWLWKAEFVPVKLKAVGCEARLGAAARDSFDFKFTAREIEKMAIMEHDHWIVRKLKLGYIWGPERDDHGKPPQHPFMVPYGDLPKEQQDRYKEFCKMVPRVLGNIGYKIVRIPTEY